MRLSKDSCCVSLLQPFSLACLVFQVHADDLSTTLIVNASEESGRRIPDTLFGIFFEEINHAGAGGLWAEFVSNRGFESGGPDNPSNIDPWQIIGNESSINVETDRTSCFDLNKVALRLSVLCDSNECPAGGVGVYNPGFWGMNIEQGKEYKVVFYVRSTGSLNLTVSLTGSNGEGNLASVVITGSASDFSNWTKVEALFEAKATNRNSRLQLTTTAKGVIWLDQVSAMPVDTYKGHGFRSDLAEMLEDIKPRFLRFPGISHTDQVNTSAVLPFVQDALDGIEFARADPTSKWGSIRAAMGHPKPFDLRYVAVGNEDCEKENYQGNYLIFFSAIKKAYADIQIISNCDASSRPLDHSADLYDYHVYTDAKDMFSRATTFSQASRSGPKAFVSEYAVNGNDSGTESLLAGLAEAGFLIGLEKNSDVVQMASYAPLFVNANDRRWNPDAIVFNSFQLYGTPSYWMQLFFAESSGGTLLNSSLQTNSSDSLVTSAIAWQNPIDKKSYIRMKAVNFGASSVNFKIYFDGLDQNSLQPSGSTKTVLTSANVMDENSFSQPKKVVPIQNLLQSVGLNMNVTLPPYSFTSLDLLKHSSNLKKTGSDSSTIYSKKGWEVTKEKINERKSKRVGRKYMQ